MMLERLHVHVCVLPVILVVLCCIVPVENPPLTPKDPLSDSYVVSCPTPLKITQRDLNCSNNKVYHIVWNSTSGSYIEGCFITLQVPSGYAPVMDKSGNLNTEACHEGTFQRHSYKSNTQCACKERKGHCNETGQVVASNGSTTEDRTCRCDNECFCQSSSEYCTCKKIECETGYRLSPDYECVPENSTTNYTCKDYISEESTTKSVPDNDTSIPDKQLPWYMIAIIVIGSAIVIFCVLICCKKCRRGRNGSATTNNEGKQNVPVQVTGTSKGKDSHPVQETGSDRANEKLIKVDKWKNEVTYKRSTEDTVLNYTVE